MLSKMASTVIQARIDNLNKVLELPGILKQLFESHTKLLIDQDLLDSLISKKSATKHQRIHPFCMRQQSTISKDSYSSNFATAPSTSTANSTEVVSRNKITDRQ
ncbi:hypothetical protein AYI69_g4415 [Smittium culicis]|uniref:Uncharacterized protein n=1 Tax=Smittium culicis TaxID=133412 RepID=A0A1R1YDT0_9FUNG|nr:hypothetical protein AYI69_g4415 [Smittium culicis]